MIHELAALIRDYYQCSGRVALHEPRLEGEKEREYVLDALDSTFVSSVGPYVDRFEENVAKYTGAEAAVATMNGTSALHVALVLANVTREDLVITQALTFVATANAIAYCGADPIFVDVDKSCMGMSPDALKEWLENNAFVDDSGVCRERATHRAIKACLPVHVFGHPADVEALNSICLRWNILLIEDAAESLGSFSGSVHTGTTGSIGVFSFNGNKIITTGGGGMILASREVANRAKYLTTTAKDKHDYEFFHREIGFNYRMPNINAALGCAQLEKLEDFVRSKRELSKVYYDFFKKNGVEFVVEPDGCRSNYWLNAIILEDKNSRDSFLSQSNNMGIMTRPVWTLMNRLPMYQAAESGYLPNSNWLEQRVVNLPSSVKVGYEKT